MRVMWRIVVSGHRVLSHSQEEARRVVFLCPARVELLRWFKAKYYLQEGRNEATTWLMAHTSIRVNGELKVTPELAASSSKTSSFCTWSDCLFSPAKREREREREREKRHGQSKWERERGGKKKKNKKQKDPPFTYPGERGHRCEQAQR